MQTAEARLYSFARFSEYSGLEGVSRLLNSLGNPQSRMKFVHIAGTNGKGSTTAMIAAGLTSAGYKTGMYTSPSVEKLTERVCVNMEPVADGVFAGALNRVMDRADEFGLRPAQFDILTAAAFCVFADMGCEIVASEVGLGGRFDATNIIDPPEVAVIMSVSLDHVGQLGSDIAGIAREKCGILKKNSSLVVYPCQQEAARTAIEAEAEALGIEAKMPDLSALEILEKTNLESRISYRGKEYSVKMPGQHFVLNAITAIEAMNTLVARGYKLKESDIAAGVATLPLTGRLQTLMSEPMILADGAHNPDAAKKLCDAMTELFPNRRIITVMGMFSDKECAPCVEAVAGISDVFIATAPAGPRAQKAEKIMELAMGRAKFTAVCPRVRNALIQAVSFWRPGDVILCCGSFGLGAEVKKTLAKYAPYISEFTK